MRYEQNFYFIVLFRENDKLPPLDSYRFVWELFIWKFAGRDFNNKKVC